MDALPPNVLRVIVLVLLVVPVESTSPKSQKRKDPSFQIGSG